MLHAIVMAGGSGTRFWPASRAALPKQLLPLAGTTTLLEDTVARLETLVPPERLMIVTSARLLPAVRHQLPAVPEAGLVGEPCKRDTAPCIGLAALLVSRHDPDAIMAVRPSDHCIAPAASFRAAIRQAEALEAWLAQLLQDYGDRVLALDSDAAQLWGRMRVPHPEHALDKQIAAIALLHELTVVTRNTADFASTEVTLLNPFHPQAG